jgi:hypothetical protein
MLVYKRVGGGTSNTSCRIKYVSVTTSIITYFQQVQGDFQLSLYFYTKSFTVFSSHTVPLYSRIVYSIVRQLMSDDNTEEGEVWEGMRTGYIDIRIWLTDHEGVTLCLRTEATNGPIVHPPGDMWTWRAVVLMMPAGNNFWLVHQTSLAVLPAEISRENSRNGRRSENFAYQYLKYFKEFLHAVKSYDMRPPASLPIRRKVCCGFLWPLKIYRLRRVWTRDPWVQWQAH